VTFYDGSLVFPTYEGYHHNLSFLKYCDCSQEVDDSRFAADRAIHLYENDNYKLGKVGDTKYEWIALAGKKMVSLRPHLEMITLAEI